jgi:hypothetical protein
LPREKVTVPITDIQYLYDLARHSPPAFYLNQPIHPMDAQEMRVLMEDLTVVWGILRRGHSGTGTSLHPLSHSAFICGHLP